MEDIENQVIVDEIPAVEEIVETPVEPVDDWRSKYEDLESKFREANQKSAQFDALMQRWDNEKLNELTETVTNVGVPDEDGGFKPLTDQQKTEVASLIKDGYTWRKAARSVQEQNILSEALINAWAVVGDNAPTIKLREIMTEMVELGDPRLMKRHAAYLKQTNQNTFREQRTQIDRVPTSPAAPVPQMSIEFISSKLAQPGGVNSLSAEEKRMYNEYRKANNLPTVRGWS